MYRWDRAGCVMTEPINLVENPWEFFDLLYALARIARHDPRVWGYDETVTKATKEEIDMFEAQVSTGASIALCRRSTNRPQP